MESAPSGKIVFAAFKSLYFLLGGRLNKRKRLFLSVGAFFGNKLTKYLCSGLCFCLQWRRLNEAAAPDE